MQHILPDNPESIQQISPIQRYFTHVVDIAGVLSHEAQHGDVLPIRQGHRTGSNSGAGYHNFEARLDHLLHKYDVCDLNLYVMEHSTNKYLHHY